MSRDSGAEAITFVMVLLVVGTYFGYVNCIGCAATDDEAIHTLRAHGFREIKLGDPQPLKCDDSTSRGFTATNVRGEPVSGTVCCNWFAKGCTVRW